MTVADNAVTQRLAFACRTVRDVQAVALGWFRTALDVDDKARSGPLDPVTAADREIEALLRSRIGECWPDDAILGEEQGLRSGTSGITWVLDPIDGTGSFMTGMLHWGVLIAINAGSGPVAGLLFQPFTGELFSGIRGQRSVLERAGERQPLTTRSCPALENAVLGTTGPHLFADGLERSCWEGLLGRVRMVRFGGDCYLYAMLAAGHFDMVLEAGLHPWDIQALVPIVEGAGGRVTTWDGGNPATGGRILACGDPQLHTEALAWLDQLRRQQPQARNSS